MKISIKWQNSKHQGTAKVVESCCDGIKQDEEFILLNIDGKICIGLYQDDDDACWVPFNYCPCCGMKVKIVSEIELSPVTFRGVVGSGATFIFQQSGLGSIVTSDKKETT